MKKRKTDLNTPGFFLESGFLHWQGPFSELSTEGISISLFGNREWFSPLRAPYGGFIFSSDFDSGKFRNFLTILEKRAEDQSVFSLEIQLAPACYFGNEFIEIDRLLQDSGFKQLYQDLNFHLPIDRPFIQHLHRSERWKLQKAEKLGFSFQPVPDPDLDFVYSFILASRRRKGYQLSMSLEELKSSFREFPGRYNVWAVLAPDGRVAAQAITVHVSAETEYLFYTADDYIFRYVSPVVMLHRGIYEFIIQKDKQIMDLGTASLGGIINKGVADFKRFLGGVESAKIRYRKVFH